MKRWHGCAFGYTFDFGRSMGATKARGWGSMRVRGAVRATLTRRRFGQAAIKGCMVRTLLRSRPRKKARRR